MSLSMSRLIEVTVPPRTVKTDAKALSICPQRCVEGQQLLIHNCTDSSVQLINSSPIYMTSKVKESHIIADEKTTKTAWKVRNDYSVSYKTASKGDESIYLFQILESNYETLDTFPLETKRQNVNEVIHPGRLNKLYEKQKVFCCLHLKSFSKHLSKWLLQQWYFTLYTVAVSCLRAAGFTNLPGCAYTAHLNAHYNLIAV